MPIDIKTVKQLMSPAQAKKLLEGTTEGPWAYDGLVYIFADINNEGAGCQMIADDGGDENEQMVRIRGAGAQLPMDKNAKLLAAAPSLAHTVIAMGEAIDSIQGVLEDIGRMPAYKLGETRSDAAFAVKRHCIEALNRILSQHGLN